MLGLILLASGFEDTEAIVTIDILRRASVDIEMCSVCNEDILYTQNRMNIKAEISLNEALNKLNDYDFLVIPGGKAVFNTLSKLQVVYDIISHFNNRNKLIACICAAPMLLGKLGLLEGKNFTCFPSCEKGIEGIYTASPCEVEGNIITGKAMGYTVPFALAIVEKLLGNNIKEQVNKSIHGM